MRMRNFSLGRRLAVGVVLIAALAGFVLSDAVLQRNTARLSGRENQNGDFGQLVSWLPDNAKKAIEYRARYLFLQNRMNRTRHPDAKVEAICAFADYIRNQDPRGADAVLTGVVTLPEFKRSRRAYPAYAKLLREKNSAHPVSPEEWFEYLHSLEWPEDRFQAWSAVWNQRGRLRLSDREFVAFVRPLVRGPVPPYRNYDRFYRDIVRQAVKDDNPELAAAAQQRLEAVLKLPYLPGALQKAPLEFRERYREMAAERDRADTPERKLESAVALAGLTRGTLDAESDALLTQVVDDPALKNVKTRYSALAKLLLYRKHPRRISIEQYHGVIRGLSDDALRFGAWQAGLAQLVELKANEKTRYEYLAPLGETEPKFQEYAELMRPLATLAAKAGDAERAARAEKFLRRVQELYIPSLFETDDQAGKE